MRHLLALFLLGVTGLLSPAPLDAQVRPSSNGERYANGDRYGSQSGVPLRANVWFDEYAGLVSFDINRAAHVAIFALRPLGKIELIYPGWGWGPGVERMFRTGRHSVRPESRMYQLVRRRSGHGHSGYRASGQTYILLIASERPLDLNQFLATGTMPWLNHPSVTWNPFLAADHLAREIVPGHHRTEWTVAYHVLWPEASLRRYVGRIPHTTVLCPGGAGVSIPTHVLRTGGWRCPDRHAPPPEAARPRSPGVPTVIGTLPKRPRPTDPRRATPTRGQGEVDGTTGRIRPVVPKRPATPPAPIVPSRRFVPPRRIVPSQRIVPSWPRATPAPARVPDGRARPRPAPKPGVTPKSRTPSKVGPTKKVIPRPEARPNARVRPKPKPTVRPKAKPRPSEEE